jgi:hypothetical protein
MRIAVGIYLLVHGLCHFVGFLVPWKIITSKEEPYKTTLLAGALDVGHLGIRAIGILWLLAGLAIMATGIGAFLSWPSWRTATLGLAVASTVLCVFGLPGAKIGILANLLLFIYLVVVRLGFLPGK